MGKVVLDISTSLDGFVAGPNPSLDDPLGEGGEALHEWVVGLASWRASHGLEGGEENSVSDMVAEDLVSQGAVVMGRRDVQRRSRTVGGRPERGRLVGRGASVPQARLRPDAPRAEPLRLGETTFTFVTDGVESAVEQARAAAGDKDVLVAGGAEAAQQVLSAGLLDEAQIHLVPVVR